MAIALLFVDTTLTPVAIVSRRAEDRMTALTSHDLGHDHRAGAIEAWAVELDARLVHTWPAGRKALMPVELADAHGRVELERDLGSVIIDPAHAGAIDAVLDLLRERYPRVRWLIFRKTIAAAHASVDIAA
ncbi:MAG: hypothetical protein JNL50_14025 [Phycisphaerae bacterium]|nr:hypothetical protein [Phycisphaerae bacterium]